LVLYRVCRRIHNAKGNRRISIGAKFKVDHIWPKTKIKKKIKKKKKKKDKKKKKKKKKNKKKKNKTKEVKQLGKWGNYGAAVSAQHDQAGGYGN